MQKVLLLIFISLITAVSFGQKTKIKDNVAYLDGVAYLKWDKRGSSEISISGISSTEEEVYAMYLDYSDPAKVSKSNPEGKVRWIELNFLTLKKKCEIATRSQGGLVKFFYENNIYVNGILNAENVDKLVEKYGMRFSQNRPGGNVNIYINE